jgi:Na+/proline symporter
VSLSIIIVGILMVPVVRQYETIYTAFQSFLSNFQGPTLALLLTGLVWRRATPAGGLASLLTGVAAALAMERVLGLHFLHTAWRSFVVAMITLVAVSIFTKPLSSAELEGLVVGPSLRTGEED